MLECLTNPSASVSIREYTARGYQEYNTFLREGGHPAMLGGRIVQEMEALPAVRRTVYRGTTIESFEKGLDGEVFSDKGFLSTTVRKDLADIWRRASNGVTLTILSKTGRELGGLSMVPHEREVLFAPGTKFKVIRHPERDEGGRLRAILKEI
jgi:hypothetical protein